MPHVDSRSLPYIKHTATHVALGSNRRQKLSKAKVNEIVAKQTATANGLRYVSDTARGIYRIRRGQSFYYVDSDGKRISDEATLQRIRKLAIPPAYKNVWICAHEHGHLQATGIDARGRKQYRYHAEWRTTRDANKFFRMVEFGQRLPKLRQRLKRDLSLAGLPREKVLALVVTLLDRTLIRIGNKEYVRQNNSFGLTTLRDRHVRFFGASRAKIQFKGKSGKDQAVELSDKRITHILRRCQEVPGQHLFQYIDEHGDHQPVDSGMVNDYLLATMGTASNGTGFTAKDFRTWGATVHAVKLLAEMPVADTKTAMKHGVVDVCKRVSEQLGNTPAICRKSYINPWVFTAWNEGLGIRPAKPNASAHEHERHVLRLLKLQARHERSARQA